MTVIAGVKTGDRIKVTAEDGQLKFQRQK